MYKITGRVVAGRRAITIDWARMGSVSNLYQTLPAAIDAAEALHGKLDWQLTGRNDAVRAANL